MATESERLEAEARALQAQIQPLLQRRDNVQARLREARSREWIAAHGVTANDVQMSSGPDLPWFGTVWLFGDWLRKQAAQKRYAEWNGRIFHASDLMAHAMPDMPGHVEHLQP